MSDWWLVFFSTIVIIYLAIGLVIAIVRARNHAMSGSVYWCTIVFWPFWIWS